MNNDNQENREDRKLNKLGEWLESQTEPLVDVSWMNDVERKQFMQAVMR